MRFLIFIALVLSTPIAMAHPGHMADEGLMAGLLHPLSGLDHLLAILATGIWAAFTTTHARTLGLAFLVAMAGGAALGLTGIALPYAEAGVMASVIAAGLLLALLVTMPTMSCVWVMTFFAVFHGNVHGLELPATAGVGAYLSGMLVTTATVFLGGATLAKVFRRHHPGWVRATGTLVAVTGAVLCVL